MASYVAQTLGLVIGDDIPLVACTLDKLDAMMATNLFLKERFFQNFYHFVEYYFNHFGRTPYNAEIRHIVYRIICMKNDNCGRKPFEHENRDRGAEEYAAWLKDFSGRRDNTAPPAIPRTVETLKYIQRLLEAVEFWLRRFHLDRSRTYAHEDFYEVQDCIIRQDMDCNDEHSFDNVESYRIRRALLLFQLYCVLFRLSRRREQTAWNGHVTEQMLFLQTLPPFLLIELDGVYGMIECHLAANWQMGGSICRKAVPLHPGQSIVNSGSKLEYIVSKGLVRNRDYLLSDEFHAGFYESQQDAKDDYGCVCSELPRLYGNRFFTTPVRLLTLGLQG
ncbi:hypothetical protein F4805DRAFT_423532, partial [Annulohypoxylon moriforme]